MHIPPIPSFSQQSPPSEKKVQQEKSLPHALREFAKFLREATPLSTKTISHLKK